MEQKETYWSRFADDFEQRNNYVVGKSDVDLVLNRVATLPAMDNVLELACGDGVYSKVLARNAKTVLSTDFSDEMLKFAKNKLKNFSNIKVEKANCFNLQYPDNTFDVVFMANLIHIIPIPEKALMQVKRVLKESGTVMVLSYTSVGMKFIHKLGMITRYIKTYGKPPKDSRRLGIDDAVKLIESCGFSIVESELLGEKSKAFLIQAVKK